MTQAVGRSTFPTLHRHDVMLTAQLPMPFHSRKGHVVSTGQIQIHAHKESLAAPEHNEGAEGPSSSKYSGSRGGPVSGHRGVGGAYCHSRHPGHLLDSTNSSALNLSVARQSHTVEAAVTARSIPRPAGSIPAG